MQIPSGLQGEIGQTKDAMSAKDTAPDGYLNQFGAA